MTVNELIAKLLNLPADAIVEVEYADLGEGGNTTSGIDDVIVEDGKVILVTNDVC